MYSTCSCNKYRDFFCIRLFWCFLVPSTMVQKWGSPHETLDADLMQIRDPKTTLPPHGPVSSGSELCAVLCDSALGQCIRSSPAVQCA